MDGGRRSATSVTRLSRNDQSAADSDRCLELLLDLVNGEARRLHPRRELDERPQEVADNGLSRHQQEGPVEVPVPVSIRRGVGALERVCAQVVKPRYPGVELAFKLGLGLTILVTTCFVFLPWISQVVFTGIGQERTLRFVWLVAALMGAGALSEVVEIEAIVGAFFAGLGLNRLVPNRSELMERTEFLASALFIPMFLVSVGDKINPEVIADPETLAYAAAFLGAVVVGKASAAMLAGRAFHFSPTEVGAMFSLSIAQAAATLAATIVGVEAGILDEQFLNAAIVVVTATLFIASVTAVRFGQKLPTSAASESRLGDAVIVPILPGVELAPLLALAARIALADGGVVRPIEINEGGMTPDARKKRAEEIQRLASTLGIDCEPVVRIDRSVEEGLRSAAIQYDGTMVLIPRHERGLIPAFFSQDDAMGLARSLPVPVALASVAASAENPSRVVIMFHQQDLVPVRHGARTAVVQVARHIAGSAMPIIVVTGNEASSLDEEMDRRSKLRPPESPPGPSSTASPATY